MYPVAGVCGPVSLVPESIWIFWDRSIAETSLAARCSGLREVFIQGRDDASAALLVKEGVSAITVAIPKVKSPRAVFFWEVDIGYSTSLWRMGGHLLHYAFKWEKES